MRCPSCQKFVGLETGEPEEQSVEVTDNGEDGSFSVEASFRLPRTCADCGEELKEATFELTADGALEHTQECKDAFVAHLEGGEDAPELRELEVEVESSEATEESITKDRNGRKITNPRYMKTEFGVSVEFKVTCACGATESVMASDACTASSFDELV